MITKKFSKTYDEVLTQSYLFQSELIIDQAVFEEFSSKFAEPYAENFLTLITAADNIPTNEDDLNNQTWITNELELQMEPSRLLFQKLLLHVGFAWPDDEAKLKVFGNNLYAEARRIPAKMINLLQNAYREASSTAYKTSLIAAGFTQLEITQLDALAAGLKSKLLEQQSYIRHTYGRTEERTEAFNKVWDVMVQISTASKMIFKDSPAKIEFYLLYPEGQGPGGLPGKPSMLWFQYPERTIWWNLVDNATSYQLERLDGSEYVEIFAGSGDNFPYVPPDGLSKYRIRGRNANGFGPYSDVMEQWFFAILPKASNIQIVRNEIILTECTVTCDLIPTVVEYRFYQSVDVIGQAPAHWLFLSIEEVPSRVCNLTLGKRNYFRIECSNMSQYSLSDPVFIDVYE